MNFRVDFICFCRLHWNKCTFGEDVAIGEPGLRIESATLVEELIFHNVLSSVGLVIFGR